MSYTPNVWETGDIITAAKLNNIENGVENNDAVASKIAVFHLTLSVVNENPTLTAEVSAAEIAEAISNGKFALFTVSNGSGLLFGWASYQCNIDEEHDSVGLQIIAAAETGFECSTTLSSTDPAVFTPIS